MTSNLVSIQIVDEKTLLDACDLLHDSKFDLTKSTYDSKARIWKGTFKREFFEDPTLMTSKRKFIFLTKHIFPMAEASLTIKNVESINVVDKADIEEFTFNECQPEKNAYRLIFCEDMEIELNINGRPNGKFKDIQVLEEKGSLVTFRDKLGEAQTNQSNKSLNSDARNSGRAG